MSAPLRAVPPAPGAVPLRVHGGRISVGGTIRAIGHRWHPVFTLPYAAWGLRVVIVGSAGSGKSKPGERYLLS
jgi:hypothetical protein